MKIRKIATIAVVIASLVTLTACAENVNNTTDSITVEGSAITVKNEVNAEPTGQQIQDLVENTAEVETTYEEEVEDITAGDFTQAENKSAVEIKCVKDDVGIYSTIVELSDSTADKGTVEMVYTGAKGTAQEGTVVNEFILEYYKTDDGLFEIKTFYDGEVYQNKHGESKVKFVHTFSAAVRAYDVKVYYTPDESEKQEVCCITADEIG